MRRPASSGIMEPSENDGFRTAIPIQEIVVMNETYTPPERRQRKQTSELWGKSALGVAVLALLLAGAALYFALPRPEPEEPPPEPVPEVETILYRGQELPILEDVPVNAYDAGDFSIGPNGWNAYEKDGKRAAVGIDVSFYQGEIDWQQVAASGVEFAMIRLGYRGYSKGALQMDSKFEENIQGALDAGLEVGVYFFSQAVNTWEAEEEADFVLQAIEPYPVTCPVVFDWEFISGEEVRTAGLEGAALTRCAGVFCDMVQAEGYQPMIYFNQDLGYLYYDLSALKQYPFWLAQYAETPGFYYHFDMWQYSHTGQVPGIEGNVDLNLFFSKD